MLPYQLLSEFGPLRYLLAIQYGSLRQTERTTALDLHHFSPPISLCLAMLTTAAVAQDSPYTQRENVVYGEVHGIGLLMDVFTPTSKANGLAIVDVISGSWYSDRGKIRDHTRAQTF